MFAWTKPLVGGDLINFSIEYLKEDCVGYGSFWVVCDQISDIEDEIVVAVDLISTVDELELVWRIVDVYLVTWKDTLEQIDFGFLFFLQDLQTHDCRQ